MLSLTYQGRRRSTPHGKRPRSFPQTHPMDGERLRAVMRRVPAPVAVVTASGAGESRGMTISSFTSVSLDPPLISFNVRAQARMYPVLQATSHFAVHLLSEQHVALSRCFARPGQTGVQQFSQVAHRVHACGTPILDAALAVLYCRRYALYPAGDHAIVVGQVVAIEEDADGRLLLYHDGAYHTVGDTVKLIDCI